MPPNVAGVPTIHTSGKPEIRKLVGVYDADGSAWGELTYFIGARLGRRHCALCDITHGLVRERPEWKTCRSSLPLAFDTYHLDDQPEGVRAAHADHAPVVLAATDDGYVVLLARDELSECAGSVERFSSALDSAAARAGLSWPS